MKTPEMFSSFRIIGSIIFVVGKSPMDLMEPILYRKKVP